MCATKYEFNLTTRGRLSTSRFVIRFKFISTHVLKMVALVRQMRCFEQQLVLCVFMLIDCLFTVIWCAELPPSGHNGWPARQEPLNEPLYSGHREVPADERRALADATTSDYKKGIRSAANVWPANQVNAQLFEYSNNLTRSLPKVEQQYRTIEINGSSLTETTHLDPMSGSESKPTGVFSYANLAPLAGQQRGGPGAGAATNQSSKEFNNNNNNNNRRPGNFMRTLRDSSGNSKLLLLNYSSLSSTSRPKLSLRSYKFLQNIKNKRKSTARPPSQQAQQAPQIASPGPVATFNSSLGHANGSPSNLTESASYKHEKWITFSGGDFDDELEDEPGARQELKPRTPTSGDLDDGPDETAPVPNAPASSEQQRVAAPAESGYQLQKPERERAEPEQAHEPLVGGTTNSKITTVEGGAGRKIVIKHEPGSRDNKLPAKLRQKIIEQFIRNGGDPQNIVLSDSTITTTSQSKKKTITTVYKIVPTTTTTTTTTTSTNAAGSPSSDKWRPSPRGQTKGFMSDDNDDNYDNHESNGNKNNANDNAVAVAVAAVGGAGDEEDHDERHQDGRKTNLFNQRETPAKIKVFKDIDTVRPKKRRLKKILVTRIEMPKGGAKMDGESIERHVNENLMDAQRQQELGEFYTGPHASIFGLDDQDSGKFSAAQQEAVPGPDQMGGEPKEGPVEHTYKMLDEGKPDHGDQDGTGEFMPVDRLTKDQQEVTDEILTARKPSKMVGKFEKSPSKVKQSATSEARHESQAKGGSPSSRTVGKNAGSQLPNSGQAQTRPSSESDTGPRNRQTVEKAPVRARISAGSGKHRSAGAAKPLEKNDHVAQEEMDEPRIDQRGEVKSSASRSKPAKDGAPVPESQPSERAQPSQEAGSNGAPQSEDQPSRPTTGTAATFATTTTTSTTTTTTRRPASRRQQASDSLTQLKRAVLMKLKSNSASSATSTSASSGTSTSTTGAPSEPNTEEADEVEAERKATSKSAKRVTTDTKPKSDEPSPTPQPSMTNSTSSTGRVSPAASGQQRSASNSGEAIKTAKSATSTVDQVAGRGQDEVAFSGGFLPSTAPARRAPATASEASNKTTSRPSGGEPDNQVAPAAPQQPAQVPVRTHNIMMLIDFDSPHLSFGGNSRPPQDGLRGLRAAPLVQSADSFGGQQWRPVGVAQSATENGGLERTEANRIETVRQSQASVQSPPTVSVSIYNNLAGQQEQRRRQQQRQQDHHQHQQYTDQNFNLNSLAAQQMFVERQQQQRPAQQQIIFEQSQPKLLAELDDFTSTNHLDQNFGRMMSAQLVAAHHQVGATQNNYARNRTNKMPILMRPPAATASYREPSFKQNDLLAVPLLFASSNASPFSTPLTVPNPDELTRQRQQQQQQQLPPQHLGYQRVSLLPGESVLTNQVIQHVIDEISESALANGYQVDNQVPVTMSRMSLPSSAAAAAAAAADEEEEDGEDAISSSQKVIKSRDGVADGQIEDHTMAGTGQLMPPAEQQQRHRQRDDRSLDANMSEGNLAVGPLWNELARRGGQEDSAGWPDGGRRAD